MRATHGLVRYGACEAGVSRGGAFWAAAAGAFLEVRAGRSTRSHREARSEPMVVAMGTDVLARNNVTAGGRPGGPVMVFAHGFGCDQNMWRFVVPAFERDYRTVLFDFVGAGASDLSAYDPQRYGSLH